MRMWISFRSGASNVPLVSGHSLISPILVQGRGVGGASPLLYNTIADDRRRQHDDAFCNDHYGIASMVSDVTVYIQLWVRRYGMRRHTISAQTTRSAFGR